MNLTSCMMSFEVLFGILCYQRKSLLKTSYVSGLLNMIYRMMFFAFLIWFLCYQSKSRLKTSHFWGFLNRISRMMFFYFNLIPMLSERIVAEHFRFILICKLCVFSFEFDSFLIRQTCGWTPQNSKDFQSGFLAWCLWVFNLIPMLSGKIVAGHLICLRISKQDFSHGVFWVLENRGWTPHMSQGS